MTQRKPPGVTWETWIDRQIRVGMDSGAFDDLPGAGTPLRDLDRPRDEMWWVREKVRREKLAHVPVTVQVRRELDDALAAIAVAPSEEAVRTIVAAINERVRWVNSRPVTGPPSTVAPLDAEAEVRAWRERRPSPDAATAVGAPTPPTVDSGAAGPPAANARPEGPARRRRWWRRTRSA